MPRAKAVAQKALDIDESLAEAHTTLAEAHKDYDWDWAASEKEFKRAIELNPNYATAHMWYAEYLSLTRRHAEAIAEAQRAQQLDPLSPVVRVVLATFGGYFYARQYDEAIRTLRDANSLFPEYPQPYWLLVPVYEAKDTKRIERDWAKYRVQNRLDLYGQASATVIEGHSEQDTMVGCAHISSTPRHGH